MMGTEDEEEECPVEEEECPVTAGCRASLSGFSGTCIYSILDGVSVKLEIVGEYFKLWELENLLCYRGE